MDELNWIYNDMWSLINIDVDLVIIMWCLITVYDLHIAARASLLGKSKNMRFSFDYTTLNVITGCGGMRL